MTYNICMKLIASKKKRLAGEEWEKFAEDTKNKLDVFLLANRITGIQYNELVSMIS